MYKDCFIDIVYNKTLYEDCFIDITTTKMVSYQKVYTYIS